MTCMSLFWVLLSLAKAFIWILRFIPSLHRADLLPVVAYHLPCYPAQHSPISVHMVIHKHIRLSWTIGRTRAFIEVRSIGMNSFGHPHCCSDRRLTRFILNIDNLYSILRVRWTNFCSIKWQITLLATITYASTLKAEPPRYVHVKKNPTSIE